MSTDDVSKLPAFPAPVPQGGVDLWGTIQWLTRDRDAYRARMEALMEYAKHKCSCLKGVGGDPAYLCDCGLDALLAACEREEGR